MKIKYKFSRVKNILKTRCPGKYKNSGTMVGSYMCGRCEFFVSNNDKTNIVECEWKKC